MRIIGLDVCKSSVVLCCLDTENNDLSEPRQLYYDLEFHKCFADAAGLAKVLSFNPDVAILEPTGINYSKIWVSKLSEHGVNVVSVGHKQLRSFRESLDLPDKDDEADSLALALYWHQYQNSDRRFVRQRDPVIAKMRELSLRLQHLNRLQSPAVNRARQDLAWQFPECAFVGLDAPLFWGWLAGYKKSARYDNRLAESIGSGIEDELRNNAALICDIQERELKLEFQIRELLHDPRFAEYRQVFAQFGFGERVEALLLTQIYPIENYLLDGRPEIKVRRGRNSGKPTAKHLSLRRFKKALGVAPIREESGDKKATKKGGSQLARTALWQWIFTRVEPRNRYPKTPTGVYIKQLYDGYRQSNPTKLARSKTAAKAVELLFRKLVEIEKNV